MEVARGTYIKALALLAVALGLHFNSFADNFLTLTCTDDGHGLYTYTFTRGTGPFVWGLLPNTSNGIQLQSHGIITTIQPPGWISTITTNGLITWRYTNGFVLLTNRVTFSVLSFFTVPRPYQEPPGATTFPKGAVVGEIFTPPSTNSLATGYQEFGFIGPNTNCAPILKIQKFGSKIVISWPSAAANVTLQTTTTPANPNSWITVTNPPAILGHDTYVTNTVTTGVQYFRAQGHCN